MRLKLLVLFSFLLQHMAMGQSYFKTDYPGVWQRSTAYTLEVAKAMPADKYSFKPKDENMSFQGQLVHLVQNLSYLSGQITGTPPAFLSHAQHPDSLSKEEVAAALQKSFTYVQELAKTTDEKTLGEQITFAGVNMTKENIFYLMRDHMTHHRAQAILYLRMNNVAPPGYRGW